jgi:ABC-2 type transport system permease protein
MDMLSIGYVHPLTQTILCIWAIGRAAGAIAGEIDRGTMELLLAQPISRSKVLAAHLSIDAVAIPILCLSMWVGTFVGTWLVGLRDHVNPLLRTDSGRFVPALLNVAALVFAVSGVTMWLSAAGRFRSRVLGLAVLLALLQFLVNVIGQLWSVLETCRPFTVFYYYQPQAIILDLAWYEHKEIWLRLGVLLGVGSAGYGLAWLTFCRRDLPAPL